jgi:SAM-dependent methyltransferase
MRASQVFTFTWPYRLFQGIVRGDVWKIYLETYVQPSPGVKLLDLGCGPADILALLPQVNYTGVDSNRSYIESAIQRFGRRARFLCEDACTVDLGESKGTFDLVIATGVIHHLDERQAEQFIQVAYSALVSDGRFVTIDPCRVPGQGAVVEWLIRNDRGQFVRSRHEYERLASLRFEHVESEVRHDLLRIPYTHCILRCHKA